MSKPPSPTHLPTQKLTFPNSEASINLASLGKFLEDGENEQKMFDFFKALLWPNWLIFFKYSQLIFKGATKILKASLSPYLNLFQSRGVPVWGPEHNSNTGGCQSKQILGCPIKNHPICKSNNFGERIQTSGPFCSRQYFLEGAKGLSDFFYSWNISFTISLMILTSQSEARF